ncbi:DUF2892 family protein [Arthrobacter sp. SLBN-100]|uniref:DUF2892 domain-containing protein n=1 Tax=Arthrobacter sp. SLBN-100 TaxID=2768450 RepID=UPI00114D7AA9|nr:DUF2892 domain-containing protein [Arthrobacter sp. SLBN-100]TQJ67800.1 DUF2892 family protein [Arthrobacter sp. SLBN-100]
MTSGETDHVRAQSPDSALEKIDRERLERLRQLAAAVPQEIGAHLRALDKEWDIERVLEANASALTILAVSLAAVKSRKWLILAGIVPGFLLQHALQGWCPPIEIFRRMGVRTRKEIDIERTALKALRGDFVPVPDTTNSAGAAEWALTTARSR